MNEWDPLARELDLWRAADRAPTFWWRDDDAVEATPALEELQRVAQVPLALAVIPAAPDRPLQASLAEMLVGWPQAFVLQHGIAHQSHAPAGTKNSEFPAMRPAADVEEGLMAAFARLRNNFGIQFLPVLTPPWNRIAAVWLPRLPALGFRGLTRFAEPPFGPPPLTEGLLEVNTAVDVIDWRGSRGFVGLEVALGRLVQHLAARRTGLAAPAIPTGILTHHLVHDTATWRFLENLQDWLAQRGVRDAFVSPSVLWLPR